MSFPRESRKLYAIGPRGDDSNTNSMVGQTMPSMGRGIRPVAFPAALMPSLVGFMFVSSLMVINGLESSSPVRHGPSQFEIFHFSISG